MLLKFRTDKGRDPSVDTCAEDAELLLQIRNDVLDALGVSPDLLPDDFVRCVWAAGGRSCWLSLTGRSQVQGRRAEICGCSSDSACSHEPGGRGVLWIWAELTHIPLSTWIELQCGDSPAQ